MPVFDTFTIQAPNTSDTTRAFALKQNAINSLMQPLNNLTKLAERSAQAEQAYRAAQVMAHLQGYTTPDSYLSALRNEDLTGLTPEAVKAITMDRPDQLRNAILNERKVADAEKRTDLYGQLGFGNLQNDINRTEIMNKRLPIEQTTADAAMKNATSNENETNWRIEKQQQDQVQKELELAAKSQADSAKAAIDRANSIGDVGLAELEAQRYLTSNAMLPDAKASVSTYVKNLPGVSLSPREGKAEDIDRVLGTDPKKNPYLITFTDPKTKTTITDTQESALNSELAGLTEYERRLESRGALNVLDENGNSRFKNTDDLIAQLQKESPKSDPHDIANRVKEALQGIHGMTPGMPNDIAYAYIYNNMRTNNRWFWLSNANMEGNKQDAEIQTKQQLLHWQKDIQLLAQVKAQLKNLRAIKEAGTTQDKLKLQIQTRYNQFEATPEFKALAPEVQLALRAKLASNARASLDTTQDQLNLAAKILDRVIKSDEAAGIRDKNARTAAEENARKAAAGVESRFGLARGSLTSGDANKAIKALKQAEDEI